ncbi:MAG: bacteriocin [Thermoclostridium sp.]|nr:bacteriocin [Thermoclostridium sp.]
MTKEKENELQKSVDKELADDELEQVSGGHIELVNDPTNSGGRELNTKRLSRGDHMA